MCIRDRIGRNTQGVKVIGVTAGEHLISVEKVDESEEDDESLGVDSSIEGSSLEENSDSQSSDSSEGADEE